MKSHNDNRPELFVDNERYDWDEKTVSGAQIKELAGVPDDVQLFHKIPSQPDVLVNDCDEIDLDEIKGPDRFYTQCVGSQAG